MFRSIIIAFVAFLLIGCSATAPATNTSQASGSAATSGSYPVPLVEGYPAASVDGYPSVEQGPQFAIKEPVRASDTQILGTGPAGVPIKIVDVTDGGTILSQVTIGTDGSFSADVQGQLQSGNRVAVQLGSTAGTQVDPNTFQYGPGYQDIPPIGIVFASTLVE